MSDRGPVEFELRLPFIPSGAKNGRNIVVTTDGRRFPKTKPLVERQWRQMAHYISHMEQVPDFGNDELWIEIDLLVDEKECIVRIGRLGGMRKPTNGRGNDLDNAAATLFDGLTKAKLVQDDRLFGEAIVKRVRKKPLPPIAAKGKP